MIIDNYPSVSIVVIGHNEGNNLNSCFAAINDMDYPKNKLEVIYVDSNSNDKSSLLARNYTDKVVEIKSTWPTAGEAFNKGIMNASCEYVHITAGDIKLHPAYLRTAINELEHNEQIHAITGYFIEKNNKGWNKILAYRREEDSKQTHLVDTPNGGTFRKWTLQEVNGYDERIKKGQETEIGLRFKERGFKILHMNIPQGIHDFELNSLGDMLKRNWINGFSLGHLLLLSIFKPSKYLDKFKKSAIKQLLLSGGFIAILLLLLIYGGLKFILVWLLFYILYFFMNVIIRQKHRTFNHKVYFLVNGYFSMIVFFGMLGFIVFFIRLRCENVNLMVNKKGLAQN